MGPDDEVLTETRDMEDGRFERDTNYLSSRITADGRDGWPVEAGRYRLVVAHACPWANRTWIVRRLMGLEDAISLGIAGPVHDEVSWTFDLDPGEEDPVLGIHTLREAYDATFADYDRGVIVPTIVDVPSGQVVTNDYRQITLDFGSEWSAHHRDGAPDLYPEGLRDQIDDMAETNFHAVNNGVYKAGFATSQDAYEKAFCELFARLDELEQHLSTRRYLVGDTITEADVRLWPTLVRFDVVYHNHFKANRSLIREMPALWGYARDLFQTPGFGDTIDFHNITRHYYETHRTINPNGVVPVGPPPEIWLTSHGREDLGGHPFGDGTPPPPPPAAERTPVELPAWSGEPVA